MMAFLGLDPGQSGGWALLRDDGIVLGHGGWPETELDTFDAIADRCGADTFAAIEAVHSMPGQGVSSSFKFGRHYGFLRGCLVAARVPFEAVAPGKWQRAFGLLGKGAKGTEKKNLTKAAAQRLFPNLKITHATADALLIAEWCRRSRLNPS